MKKIMKKEQRSQSMPTPCPHARDTESTKRNENNKLPHGMSAAQAATLRRDASTLTAETVAGSAAARPAGAARCGGAKTRSPAWRMEGSSIGCQ